MPERLAGEAFSYLTTTGRRTGTEHTIEIWFAAEGPAAYLISGGGDAADWVRNLRADPRARLRVGDHSGAVRARLPMDDGAERDRAVELLHEKYGAQVTGTLEGWRRSAYIVALDAA